MNRILELAVRDAGPPTRLDVGLFGIAALRALRQNALEFFAEVERRSPDAAHFKLGSVDVFQFTHPAFNHEVLVEKHRSFRKSTRVKRVLGQWSGDGLALIDGEPWARLRRLVNPAFKADRVASHGALILRNIRACLGGWQHGQELEITRSVNRFTLGVATEAFFGTDIEPHLDEFAALVDILNQCALRELNSMLVLPKWAPTPAKNRLRRAARGLDELIAELMRRSLTRPPDSSHLMSILRASVDEQGKRLAQTQLHDAVVNVLLGANETTAVAITWTLFCLSRHQDIQSQLRAELDSVLEGGEPVGAKLQQLGSLERALKEAMRLYPPIYAIPREAASDVTIGGRHVPRGSLVNVVPYVTQRDPRWFENPEAFWPARFEREAELPQAAYLPFGLGPRACIGRGFAMLEAMIALAAILSRFRVHPAPSQPDIELEAQLSLHPKGGLRLLLEESRR